MTEAYQEIRYQSPDGLDLYARDYDLGQETDTILCLHGLTRNSADFHELALHIGDKYRVISVDQRGRGKSSYDNVPSNYRPDIYCADMFTLLDHLKLEKPIVIGTSMGGIMAMMMAAMKPGVFKGGILNDIGPEIDLKGLERIKNYIGEDGPFRNWQDAMIAVRKIGAVAFPEYADNDWLNFAKRTCEERADGLIHFAYDPAISTPIKEEPEAAAPVDMWPLFASLSGIPLLVIRGETSDILSAETLERMTTQHPDCRTQTILRIGHAPMLNEPQALAAIVSFLESIK